MVAKEKDEDDRFPLRDAELFGSFILTGSSYPAAWFQANLQILYENETWFR